MKYKTLLLLMILLVIRFQHRFSGLYKYYHGYHKIDYSARRNDRQQRRYSTRNRQSNLRFAARRVCESGGEYLFCFFHLCFLQKVFEKCNDIKNIIRSIIKIRNCEIGANSAAKPALSCANVRCCAVWRKRPSVST